MKKFAKILGFLGFFVTLATAQIGTAWAEKCDAGFYWSGEYKTCKACPGHTFINGVDQGVYCPGGTFVGAGADEGLLLCRNSSCGTTSFWLNTPVMASIKQQCSGTCQGLCLEPLGCDHEAGCNVIWDDVDGSASCSDGTGTCTITTQCETAQCKPELCEYFNGTACVPNVNKNVQYKCTENGSVIGYGNGATYGASYTVEGPLNGATCEAPGEGQEFKGWILTNNNSGPYMPGTPGATIASWPCVSDPVIFVASFFGCPANQYLNEETGECKPCDTASGFHSQPGSVGQHSCQQSCVGECWRYDNPQQYHSCGTGETGQYISSTIPGTQYEDWGNGCYYADNQNALIPDTDVADQECHWECGCNEPCYEEINGSCVPSKWTAYYDCDDGSSVYADPNQPESYGVYWIADRACVSEGQTFLGWTLDSGGHVYNYNDPINNRLTWSQCADQIFKPVFEDTCYEVRFDDVQNYGHPSGYPASTPGTHGPFYKKYNDTQYNWYTNSECTEKVNGGDPSVANNLPWKEHAQFTGYKDEDGTNWTIFNANGNLTTGNNSGSDWTIDGNTVLYAQYTCDENYELDANGNYCVGDKIDVKYTCVSPVDGGEPEQRTFNDDATYGTEYPVKSVGTGNHNVQCAFTGYELNNNYVWKLQDYSGNSNNPNGEYGPGADAGNTLLSTDWQYITTTPPLTEIEFILDKSLWHLKTYNVEYRCGTINNTPVQGGPVTDSVRYNDQYFVAHDNILTYFLERCDETLGGTVSGYTLQDWTFTCDDQSYGNFNTGDPIADPNAWTYDSNNCYFTANWAQTDFVIILDSNIDQNPMNDGSDVSDPEELYTRVNDGVYSCPERTDSCEMGSLTAIPTKVVTVTLNGNGGQFTWNNGTVSEATDDSKFTFLGFYESEESNSEQYIYGEDDANSGLITNRGKEVGIGYDGTPAPYTWYAHWENRDSVILPEPIERPGFTFNGWSCVHEELVPGVNPTPYNGGDPILNGSFVPEDNATCTALWTEACYEIEFDDETNHGESTGDPAGNKYYKKYGTTIWYSNNTCTTPATLTDGNGHTTLNLPEKDNAHFTGYFDAPATTDTQVFDGDGLLTTTGNSWTVTDDATLYAQYECDAPYHLDTDTESNTYGQCVACATGTFYDPNEANPAKQCKDCTQYIHDYGASGAGTYTWTSRSPYNWSIEQCYRTCGSGVGIQETCTEVSTVSGHNEMEQFLGDCEGCTPTGKQISFYGNEFATDSNNRVNTCDANVGAINCPQGFLAGGASAANKLMAAAVDFYEDRDLNETYEPNGKRYIVGRRIVTNDGYKLDTGFVWSQVVGDAQLEGNTEGNPGTISIIYPATLAPTVADPEHHTFAGYGYPESTPSQNQFVDSNYSLTSGSDGNAKEIIDFANANNFSNMSPIIGNSSYTRNLYAQYTADPTYTLTYLCNGGETPSTDHQVTGLYEGTQFNLITPDWCTGCYEFTGWWDGSQTITPELFTNFTWNYNSDKTFIAQCDESTDRFIIYNKIPVDDVNADGTTNNGNTYVHDASGGTPTQFTCGSGITPITGHPQLENSDNVVIGTVIEWCTDSDLEECDSPLELQNSTCNNKNVYAKWECNAEAGYRLNDTGDDCVTCPAGSYLNNGNCEACPEGWTSNPPYNWTRNQCYKLCDGSNGTVDRSCNSQIPTTSGFYWSALFLNQDGTNHQITFYGNDINGTDVCRMEEVTYCPAILISLSATGSYVNKTKASQITFMRQGNTVEAGNRYIVGFLDANGDYVSTNNSKFWSHIAGPGQQVTEGNDTYTRIIYPTDMAPNPGDTGARFKGYYDAQTGGEQRVAAALGLDSSNAVAFLQTPLLENQIGDRTLYPQYCPSGQEWDPSADDGNGACITPTQVYDVKYVCGAHGTAPGEMTNTATSGQPYTVAALEGGATAACTANTGYVLKTNNSGNPLWYFNGDSSADHYTNEVINQWNFNTQSPTFTAQYDCASGYIPNGDVNDGGSCEPGVNYCLAQLPTNPDPHATMTTGWNAVDGCVYTITCDPCNETTNHSCYTHTDPDSDVNGQFTITGVVGDAGAHVLDNVFCSPSTYTVYYRCNDSASPTADITSAIYGENYTIRTNGSGIGDVLNCTSNTGQFNGWTFNGSSDPDHLYEGGTELPWTYYNFSPYPLFTAHYGQCDEGEVLINGSCETCTCPQSNWTPTGAVQSCDARPLTENSCQAAVTCNEPYGNPQWLCDGAVCSASCSTCPENQISVGGHCYDICTESCSVPSTDNGCPVSGYPTFVTCSYDVQSVEGYDTGDGRCRYIDGANVGQVIDLGACSMTGVTCNDTNYDWNGDSHACERTANYTCGNHGSSTYPMSNIVQYGQNYAVAYENGTQIADCTQVDDGYTFIDKWTLNTAPLVTNGFGTNNTIWWTNGGQTYFTDSQSPLFTAMYSCATGYYEPVPDTCCDIATTYWNSGTQQCETCPNGYHPNSNNTDCDPDGPTPDQYHRIALDRNGGTLSGENSAPVNLYTIEDNNVYSDPQRNNPFTILNSNPTKYSPVTFNYCNQNSTTDCSGSQTDSRDAYFEFKGFYDSYNEKTIDESDPGRLNDYGFAQAIGYTGTADPIATWYANWSNRSSIAQDQWFTLSDDVRPGYSFLRWTDRPNCAGNTVSYTQNNSFTGNPSNDVVYACWERTSCPDDEILIGTECKKKCWVNCTWTGAPTNPTTCPSDIANIPYVQNCTYNQSSPVAQGPGYRPYDGNLQCLDPTTNQPITPESCNYTVNCESPRVWDPDTSSCVYPSGTKWNIKFVCDTNNQVVQEYEKSVGELMESIPLNTYCVKPGYSFTQWKDAEHNDTLTAGTTNIPWTHEYNATYTPDWNDGNVYHVNLHAYSCDDPTNPDLTGTFNSYTGVQELWEKYNVAWYKNAGLDDQITTLNGSQLPTLSGWKFGGYNRTDGMPRLSCDNGTCENLSPTLIRDNEDWCAVWSKCNANEYWNNGDCISCSTATSGQYPYAAMGATSINDCYNRPCYRDCQQNSSACNIPHAETYTYVNESFIGSMYYPNTNSSACQLDIWLPETSGTVPNCQCRVATCETGYHPNNDNTACVPNNYMITLNSHRDSFYGDDSVPTALYTKFGTNGGIWLDQYYTRPMVVGTMLDNNPTKYATVILNGNGGSFQWNGYTVTQTNAQADFEFNGFYNSVNGVIQYISDTDGLLTAGLTAAQQIPDNQTWHAQWTNGSITLPNATRDGYTFNGWWTLPGGGTFAGNAGSTYTPVTTNPTLYAQWLNGVYYINYHDDEGSLFFNASTSHCTPTTYTYGTQLTISCQLTPTANSHAVFKGWCKTPGADCAATQTITSTDYGNKDYYAWWGCESGYNANNGSCVPNVSELCPATTLPNNAHATFVSGALNSNGTECIYTLKCEACTGCNNNNYTCYTHDNSANNNGIFTVNGSIGDPNVLNNISCNATEYEVRYRCNSNTAGTVSSIKATYGQSYTVEYNNTTVPCTDPELSFSGWNFNGEPSGNPSYVGGDQITWNYCNLSQPTFTAYYSQCSEGQVYVPCLGECKPKCSKPCTWPGAGTGANPSQCPSGYPTGTLCYYNTSVNQAYGYIPEGGDSGACYSTSSCSDLTPNQCPVNGDPICPEYQHWENNTCEWNTYYVTLDSNNGIEGSNFVSKLFEKYTIGWSRTDNSFTYSLNLDPDELPSPSETCKVFKGYFNRRSGGQQMIQADGYVSLDGYQPLPSTTITDNNQKWYAQYIDNPGTFTIKFRCSANGGDMYSYTVHMGDANLTAPAAITCSGVAFNQWKGSAHPEILLNTGSYFTWDHCFDEIFVPDVKAVYRVDLNANGGTFPSNDYQQLWYAVDMGWYKNDGLAPADRITFIPGDQLPIKTNSNFNGWLDNVTQQPRGNFSGTNWNLPNSISANETWNAQWGPCNPNEYWDGGVCKNCSDQTSGAFPYAVPGATSIGQCYNTCDEQCKWNSSIAASCNIPNAISYEPDEISYPGKRYYNNQLVCSLDIWAPNPQGTIPNCGCIPTACEPGYILNGQSCVEDEKHTITLDAHIIHGVGSDPDVLYTWHNRGVYLYSNYTGEMTTTQNPINDNPLNYAIVTFDLNGQGASLVWNGQTYTGTMNANVSFDYQGFWKSVNGSPRYIDIDGHINGNGRSVGMAATDDLTWHARWQPRALGTVSQSGNDLPQPTRPGYTFDGWYDLLVEGNQVYSSSLVNNDMTVYARWSDRIYTVNLVSDGNNCQPSNNTPTKLYEKYNVGWNRYTTGTFDRNLTLTDDELPTPNAGYIFDGYYDAPSGGQRVIRSDGRVIQEPNYTDDTHTWYARCVRPNGPFTVTFKCDTDGHVVQSGSVNYGANVTAPTVAEANCTKPGHTFNKWKAVVNNENIVFNAGETYIWGYYSGADFVPQWVLDAPYHVTLDQNGATQPGVTDLYEKYSMWWSLYENGNSTITQLSGNALPRKTGSNFRGYQNESGDWMGTYNSTTGVWRLPSNTTVTSDETWTAQWDNCVDGEYWLNGICESCSKQTNGEYTHSDPGATSVTQCYKECDWSCTPNGCPGTQPTGMSSCTYGNVSGNGIQYNVPGATCQLQGQPNFPQNSCQACTDCCPMNITCDKGYDLVGCECRDNRYTITLESNRYNGNGTLANPSTLYTWFNHGVYRDFARTLEMTPNENPLAVGTPSTFATVTLNGNGAYFNWHNQYGPQLQDNVDFVFDGFYDTTGAAIDPVIGIDRHITEAGQSIGTTAQNNQTWLARWLDGSVDLPSISRDGYTFDGWWTECNGGTRVSMGNQTITVPGNRTLCAHWSGKSYTVTYNCDSEGGQGGTATDSQLAYQNTTYTVRENFIPCHKDADVSNGTRYHEFENWKFNLNSNTYWPGDSIMWIFNADNPTFTANYKECPNGWYFDGSCKQCPNGYTSSDIDADSASKCYKTCDVPCTRPESQCPMNEEGVLTCTYPNNTYPLGKQYSGSDDCIYDGTAPACEPFTIMCKPGYTPDYYLSTDTGTHCTKLADHEITLDANCGQGTVIPGNQEKLYTTENTGVYLNPARTNTYQMGLNRNPLESGDWARCIVTATFNHCDNGDENCDGATTEQKTVDLGFNGYYKAETNGTRYTDRRQEDGQLKSYITQNGIDAGKGYTANATWFAQWLDGQVGSQKWPSVPTRIGTCGVKYEFVDWYTAANGGTVVLPDTQINSDVTWYAHWCESCPTSAIDHGSCTAQNCKAEFKCDDGYDWNADDCTCTPTTGLTLTYQPNGGVARNGVELVQQMIFEQSFTTLGGNDITMAGNINCKWDTVSGGQFPLLDHEYTYNQNGDTVLKAHWAACTCDAGNGVQSCSTNVVDNTCVPTVTCQGGYVPVTPYGISEECGNKVTVSCTKCPAGTYQNGNQCSQCDGNTVSAAGATVCEPCVTGYSANEEHTQCVGNPITIDWVENGGQSVNNGSCQFCTEGCVDITCESCDAHPDNMLTLANVTHSNSAMQFLGWKLFTGDSTYPAGTNVMCTYDNVGVYSGTSTAIQAQWNECQCNYPLNPHVAWCQAWFADGECKYMNGCDAGYEPDPLTVYTPAAVCNPKNYNITYKPNGGTPNRNYTQSVAYNATFTTFDWSVEHYTKAHHILAGWAVESGGVGTFDGTAALNTTYTYHTDGPTSLLAKWTECANDEISFSTDNQCHQCTCDAPNCNSYATDENKCACDATCPAGYTYDGCNCSGTVCEPICNKKQSDAIYVCGDDATGTPPATETMNYGATHTVKGQASCAKSGYTFNGWNFTGTNENYNPGATVQWNYGTDQTFTGNWCENCVQPDHGECSLNAGVAGMCSYNCNCNAGYTLVGGVCTARPVCERSEHNITYQPNGGMNNGVLGQPVIQNVRYGDGFITKPGTIFTKGNSIITAWDHVEGGNYPELNHWYVYNTDIDTILDAHWEQCTCATGNGVSSCTTSSTSENACACAGECAARYINGGCTCNGTTSCTQTCTECPAGWISNADQTECVICPENTYQSGNTCEQCPTGYTSPAGSTSIEDCYNNPISYTVHYSSNNGLDQTETQPVVYGATFTTLDGTTFTYDNHIMIRWNKISGGDYTELSHPYEYGVQEDTFLKAQWAQCTCATGNGVSSCTTSSTSENACACTGECAAGYVKGECSCSGNTCTQSCTKCADNQVEINGVCVDCSCSADGNGVVSGCGFVSNENNVCNWGTTTCDTGYNNPGDLSCNDSVHNNNCRAICSQIQSNAIYECGTGTGIPPVSELVDYGTQYIIKANAAVYGCHRENSRFAGWEFDGTQETYWPGDAVTWNYTEDRHFRAVYCNECLTDDHCTLDIPNPGECVVTCHTGYEWDSNLKKCVAKTYPGDEGITYKPNGGTPNQNYTQSVKYDAPFTTLGAVYSKARHILNSWDVESGGVGTFNGTAALNTTYTYHTDGATSLLAEWIECGINEISSDNQCKQCQCTDNNAGVTSCETRATNDDTCGCSGECAAGYVNAGCNCNGTNCTQSCKKCEDNQVSVNNVCEDCVCNVNDDSGATSCGTKSVIDNMCNWGPATCRPGYAYPTIICDGSNNQLCEASCTICPAGTYQDGEVCTSCPTCQTSLPGATSVNECFTDSTCCAPDEHIEHGECTPNVRRCSIPDATNAVRIWNPAIGTYGPCTVEVDGCKPGYHVSGNVCVKDTEACTVEHGHGERDWNGTSWGACGDVVCDPGYEPNSDYTACVECSNRRVNGDIAVSGYIYECEIAACMYQGQKYALQNGECVPICENASDETGTKVWDERTKKCIRTCKPGYKMW